MKSLRLFTLAAVIILIPLFCYAQNCEVTVKLPTSNTPGNCGFTIKDSANNVIMRELAIGGLYLNMPPSVGSIVHQGDVLSVNRGTVRLFGAGYYQPENFYYIDVGPGVKFSADSIYVKAIHSYNAERVLLDGKLTVRDSLILENSLRLNGSGCYTGSWTQCSDLRLKKNIKRIHNALDKVLNLQGFSYEWRKDEFPSYNFEEGRKIGLIAQDVERVFPELVRTEIDGIKSVNYVNMTAVLVEAIKEQQNIIDEQKRTIENLNDKMESLESRINEIQKTIRQLPDEK